MSHYEERLENDLNRIRERVVAAGRFAEGAVADAARALLRHDAELAYRVILGDHQLNRDIRALDARCHAFIARHLPSAGHLRLVSSVLRINVAIERIGDYAVTISRESVRLSAAPPEEIARDVQIMAEQSTRALRLAVDAFEQRNPELARGTITACKQVDTSFEGVFGDLVEAGREQQRPLEDLFALLVTMNRVERVADQAKNLCEETIFVETGETKAPKKYRIVFIDERNDGLSVMAEAIGRKAFPKSGAFSSAGAAPVAEPDAGFVAFMNRQGHAVESHRPRALTDSADDLADAHVIVGLNCNPGDHLKRIPFHTVLQRWDVPQVPEDLDRDRADSILEEGYRELALRIEQLMVTLHGDGAD